MTDERGNVEVFRAISGHWMERLERAAAVEFGGAASSTEFALTATQAREATVRNSVSLAITIGEAIEVPRRRPDRGADREDRGVQAGYRQGDRC